MISRRTFLGHSASAFVALQARSMFADNAVPVRIRTPLGELRGEARGDVLAYKGVPFAQPPLGALRFRPPQPAVPWKGVRDATRFAPEPIQEGTLEQSEDCLYLNVWAPKGPGPHPVLVWLYGGGFTVGRSSDPVFNGEEYAAAGIVCITIAYRLGALGLVDMEPALGAAYAGSANNGLRDTIAALTWVQQNVAAFGGDPQRVTLAGQSAGAKFLDMLLGTPSAAPLFQQAISESGGAERLWTRDVSLRVGESFADSWKRVTGTAPAEMLRCPPSQLLAVQQHLLTTSPLRFPIRSEIDGVLIAAPPIKQIEQGLSRGKRLLIGTNRDESAAGLGPHPQGPIVAKDLGNMSLAEFTPIYESYKRTFPDMSPEMLRIRSVTAAEYWLPSMRVAQAQVAAGGTTFVYRFDFPGKGRFQNLSVHAHELQYAWNHLSGVDVSPEGLKVASSMHQAWTRFIRGDNPGGGDLPPWPAYTAQNQETMIFDTTSHVENGPQADELKLWGAILQ